MITGFISLISLTQGLKGSTTCRKNVRMDLTDDNDLAVDSCPVQSNELPSPHKFHYGKDDHLKEDRFDSRYSSGYASGNLDSELNEDRFISDEDKLVPVAGLESLTLDSEDSKNHLPSIDEYSELKAKGVKCEDSGDSECDEEDEKQQQYRTVLKETYQQDVDGDTRLHMAIIQFLTDMALYFISLTPTPTLLNLKNNYLQTPLHLAVVTKQDIITRKLMTSGAQVDCRDHRGNTPLHIAAREGYGYFAKILLEPIHYEETMNNTYELPYQQIPQNLEARNYEGQMCVHLAAEGGHIDTLNVLLSKGADVNARDGKSGRTILHYAAESGCMRLLEYLVKQRHSKLDINSVTYGGLTPLMLAEGRGNEQVMRYLKSSGALSESEDSTSEEEMNEEPYDFKINGMIVNSV